MKENRYPVTAVIVGGGHRAIIYGDYSLRHPELMKIVGVADPDEGRRQAIAAKYGIPAENVFESAAKLAERPKFADAIINGTMDHQHFETAAPLLELGYDMLLEKPFAVSEEEMHRLLGIVREHNNKVMVCHVLRYTPFYLGIKERIVNGEIGDIINVQMTEDVSYHHLSTSYVRGKWANSEICKTSMLLAKSCHDIDIMTWLMGDDLPASVSSFGSLFQFRPENAPANAGTRCLVDCPIEENCRYSAKKLYIDHPDRWGCYIWTEFENRENVPIEEKIASLKNDNPFGRCIYKCDNNVVDHQSVLVNFKSGATGTHNMNGGASESKRMIHIIGTKGEIDGIFEYNKFTVSKISASHPDGFTRETVDLSEKELEGHGGGDDGLTLDFLRFIAEDEQSLSCTSIYNSVAGHLTVFLADKSREEGGKTQLCDFSRY